MSHSLCDRCEHYSSCLLNYDGVPCRKLRTAEPNNYDRLHDMDIEQLAGFMAGCHACPPNWPRFCMQYYNGADKVAGCTACWLAWFEEEQKRKRGKTA